MVIEPRERDARLEQTYVFIVAADVVQAAANPRVGHGLPAEPEQSIEAPPVGGADQYAPRRFGVAANRRPFQLGALAGIDVEGDVSLLIFGLIIDIGLLHRHCRSRSDGEEPAAIRSAWFLSACGVKVAEAKFSGADQLAFVGRLFGAQHFNPADKIGALRYKAQGHAGPPLAGIDRQVGVAARRI